MSVKIHLEPGKLLSCSDCQIYLSEKGRRTLGLTEYVYNHLTRYVRTSSRNISNIPMYEQNQIYFSSLARIPLRSIKKGRMENRAVKKIISLYALISRIILLCLRKIRTSSSLSSTKRLKISEWTYIAIYFWVERMFISIFLALRMHDHHFII